MPREVKVSPRRDWSAVLNACKVRQGSCSIRDATERLGRIKTKRKPLELAIKRPLMSSRELFLWCDGPETFCSWVRSK